MKNLNLTIVFLIAISFISCSKDDNAQNEDYYIKGKVDGTSFDMGFSLDDEDPEYYFSSGFSGSIGGPSGCVLTYNPGIEPNWDESLPMLYFELNKFYSGGSSSESEGAVFNDLFPIGTHQLNDNAHGVNIIYVPHSDEDLVYVSNIGTQNNASFKITSSTEMNDENWNLYYQEISGTFNARLYNEEDLNDYIDITDGKFKIIV